MDFHTAAERRRRVRPAGISNSVVADGFSDLLLDAEELGVAVAVVITVAERSGIG